MGRHPRGEDHHLRVEGAENLKYRGKKVSYDSRLVSLHPREIVASANAQKIPEIALDKKKNSSAIFPRYFHRKMRKFSFYRNRQSFSGSNQRNFQLTQKSDEKSAGKAKEILFFWSKSDKYIERSCFYESPTFFFISFFFF
jgi:hypothetical protein